MIKLKGGPCYQAQSSDENLVLSDKGRTGVLLSKGIHFPGTQSSLWSGVETARVRVNITSSYRHQDDDSSGLQAVSNAEQSGVRVSVE